MAEWGFGDLGGDLGGGGDLSGMDAGFPDFDNYTTSSLPMPPSPPAVEVQATGPPRQRRSSRGVPRVRVKEEEEDDEEEDDEDEEESVAVKKSGQKSHEARRAAAAVGDVSGKSKRKRRKRAEGDGSSADVAGAPDGSDVRVAVVPFPFKRGRGRPSKASKAAEEAALAAYHESLGLEIPLADLPRLSTVKRERKVREEDEWISSAAGRMQGLRAALVRAVARPVPDGVLPCAECDGVDALRACPRALCAACCGSGPGPVCLAHDASTLYSLTSADPPSMAPNCQGAATKRVALSNSGVAFAERAAGRLMLRYNFPVRARAQTTGEKRELARDVADLSPLLGPEMLDAVARQMPPAVADAVRAGHDIELDMALLDRSTLDSIEHLCFMASPTRVRTRILAANARSLRSSSSNLSLSNSNNVSSSINNNTTKQRIEQLSRRDSTSSSHTDTDTDDDDDDDDDDDSTIIVSKNKSNKSEKMTKGKTAPKTYPPPPPPPPRPSRPRSSRTAPTHEAKRPPPRRAAQEAKRKCMTRLSVDADGSAGRGKADARERCSELLDELMAASDAEPFNEPVDAEAMGVPDYYQVIKQPMDLSRLRRTLHAGRYANINDFASDVRLVFSNAMRYNASGSDICRMASRLKERFEHRFSTLSRDLSTFSLL